MRRYSFVMLSYCRTLCSITSVVHSTVTSEVSTSTLCIHEQLLTRVPSLLRCFTLHFTQGAAPESYESATGEIEVASHNLIFDQSLYSATSEPHCSLSIVQRHCFKYVIVRKHDQNAYHQGPFRNLNEKPRI